MSSSISSIEIMFSASDCALVTSLFQQALSSDDATFDKMLVIVGSGNNGKSYLMNAIEEAFPSKVQRGISSPTRLGVESKRIVCIEGNSAERQPTGAWIKETLATNPKTLYVLLCTQLPFNPEDAGLLSRLHVVVCNNKIADALKLSDIRKTIELFA